MPIGRTGVAALAAAILLPLGVRAQRPTNGGAGIGSALTQRACADPDGSGSDPACALRSSVAMAEVGPSTSPWPILASAVLPGLGQALQGVDRAMPYLVAEAFAWTGYVWHSTDFRRQRDGYRNLAAAVARAAYTPVRPVGDFAYYERMSHYAEAGRYDVVAGGILDPEPDTTTYNGAVWLLARNTYWHDPDLPPDTGSTEWKRAVTFYEQRAYDQLYRWSWSGAPDEYAQYRQLIERSNEASRRSLQALGLVIANHLLSAVDAYIILRLRRERTAAGGSVLLEGQLPLWRVWR
jgi:hypothetical protein